MSLFQPGMANPSLALFEENTDMVAGQIPPLGQVALPTAFPPGHVEEYTLANPGIFPASVPVSTAVYSLQFNWTVNIPAGQFDPLGDFRIVVSGNLDRPVIFSRDSVYSERILQDDYTGDWQFSITGLVKCFYNEGVDFRITRSADANPAITWTLDTINWKIKPLG